MHRTPALLLAITATLAPPLWAQKAQDPSSQALSAFYASDSWRALLEAAPGEWRVEWCAATGTARAIWGSGIPLLDWRENSLAEARRHANRLLAEHAELLQLGTSEFRETIGARMGRTWSFTFDQYFRGLPVVGGRADVRVNMVGRVPMFGSTAWQIPANFGVAPALTPEVATAIAWQQLAAAPTGVPQPAPVAAPRLVVWGDVTAKDLQQPLLAWEVAISNVAADGSGVVGRYYVDAKTGAVVHFTDDKHTCGAGCTNPVHGAPASAAPPVLTTVTVQGWTRTGIDAFSALVNVPLPGLVLNVPGIGNVTTDANGQFTIDIAAAVNITVGALDGRHHSPIAGTSAPSGVFTVNPGVATTIQLLTAGATINQAAHTTASYWCDRVNEYSRAILGNTAQLATADAILPTVNIANTCNAYYTNNTINFYQAGGGCSNTANATVIAHEWAHGLDDRYGGISNTTGQGLSEGWGDIIGMYLVDSPLLGSGFQTAGVPLRDGNNTRQYGSATEVHAAGESWMGFAWKLRDHLAITLASRPAAIALTDDIVVSSIVADAIDQPGAVLEVFVADDNDGNLSNGTPHSADLIWACQQHSLPYPNMPGIPNNECAGALPLGNGVNGPFTTVGSTTSAPAWSCASGGNDIWFTYVAGGAGTLTVSTCGVASWDTAIQVFSGSCGALTSVACNDDSCSLQSQVSIPVTLGTYYVRVGGFGGATGSFSLNVSGPLGTLASSVPYGTACGLASKAFYESMAAAAFDLGNSGMRLVRSGNFYVAQPGGTYVAPPGTATTLALTDDSVASVTLGTSFPYIGGTTTSLEVCSNGFVSVATGNGTGFTPSAAAWLTSTQTRWGTWHDFNPTLVGSGQVKFHEAGAISYVTWDGVYSFGTTAANTFQLQFDRSTGNVTFAWATMVASGNAWLVGYTAGGANVDPGNRDISATLPATFRTSADNAQPLALASTLPQLGTTLTFTTTQFPASSLLGLQMLGLQHIDPGVPLDLIGMPGCFQHASLDVMYPMFPGAQQGTYAMAVPNNPALMGFQMSGQSVAFVNGVNAAGLVTSNGLQITVGL